MNALTVYGVALGALFLLSFGLGVDIGWAAYYTVASRARCDINPNTCAALDNGILAELESNTSITEEAVHRYECCVEYSLNYLQQQISIMYR